MAYDTADLNLIKANVGHSGGSVWAYIEPATALATIIAAGYIDDGLDKGMKVDDLVLVGGLTSNLTKVTVVAANGDVTLV
jgi:hypothetical protein